MQYERAEVYAWTSKANGEKGLLTQLTVSWNCMNLRMLSYTDRPHMTDLTIEVKLSSLIMISAACLATSVPLRPVTIEESSRIERLRV